MKDKFINIPVDFKSLHDLRDLISNFELTSKLLNMLKDYQYAYVNSMLYTGEELLKTIPEREYIKYKVICRQSNYRNLEYIGAYKNKHDGEVNVSIMSHSFNGESKKLINSHIDKLKSMCKFSKDKNGYDLKNHDDLVEYVNKNINTLDKKIISISNIKGNENLKIFLPDFKEKKIIICDWVDGYNIIEDINDISHIKDFRYTKNINFDVDTLNNRLNMIIPFEFSDNYTVGGVWINGRENGYLSGGKTHYFTNTGKDIYSFCTRTNKFLSYKSEREPGRGWVEGGW